MLAVPFAHLHGGCGSCTPRQASSMTLLSSAVWWAIHHSAFGEHQAPPEWCVAFLTRFAGHVAACRLPRASPRTLPARSHSSSWCGHLRWCVSVPWRSLSPGPTHHAKPGVGTASASRAHERRHANSHTHAHTCETMHTYTYAHMHRHMRAHSRNCRHADCPSSATCMRA